MGAFRKVVLTRQEVIRILLAFGARELPSRTRGSHHRYEVVIDGVLRNTTVPDNVDVFPCKSHETLWFIVYKQLGLSWERFYAADEKVARRANVKYRPPRR